MENFYFYACVIALIILILLLSMIGVAISYAKGVQVYPPTYKTCPDYWVEGDGTTGNANPTFCLYPFDTTHRNRGNPDFINQDNTKIPNSTEITGSADSYGNLLSLGYSAYDNGGNPITYPATIEDDAAKLYVKMMGNDASWNTVYGNAYAGLTTRCAKRKWAIENGISWDGITNFNGCA